MKAAVVREPGRIEIVDLDRPVPGPYECLVRILNCSICSGTDRHIVDHEFPIKQYPCVLGHESIGRVIACGEKVRYFKPGDLVLRPAAVRPGETLDGYASLFGGFAEYGLIADARALEEDTPRGAPVKLPPFASAQQRVPDDFPVHLAGALITFKETLSFADQLGVSTGASVAVLGSGTVALAFVRALKLLGAAKVIVVGRRDEPLGRALKAGADAVVNTSRETARERIRDLTGGKGVDYVIEAVGDWSLLDEGRLFLANNGKIGVYGVPEAPSGVLSRWGGPGTWSIHFIAPREERVHQRALDAVRLGYVDLEWFVSHRLSLEEIEKGMELVRKKEAVKVAIDI